MTRSFYALATLVALLTGTAAAIRPARCQVATRVSLPGDARIFCSCPHQRFALLSSLFAALPGEATVSLRYEDTCGRDPVTGEVYACDYQGSPADDSCCDPASSTVDYWSLYGGDQSDDTETAFFEIPNAADSVVDDAEATITVDADQIELNLPWWSEQRIHAVRVFRGVSHQATEQWQSLGATAQRSWKVVRAALVNNAARSVASADLSPTLYDDAPLPVPSWLADYISSPVVVAAINGEQERNYARAELEAAMNEQYAPTISVELGPIIPPSPAVNSLAYETGIRRDTLRSWESYLDEQGSPSADLTGRFFTQRTITASDLLVDSIREIRQTLPSVKTDVARGWLSVQSWLTTESKYAQRVKQRVELQQAISRWSVELQNEVSEQIRRASQGMERIADVLDTSSASLNR